MKVICKETVGECFNANKREGDGNNIQYPVVKGKEYIVMGIMTLKTSNYLYYLVDELDVLSWVPYELFDISDNQLSFNWAINEWEAKIFNKKNSAGDLYYVVGFKELCNDEKYRDDLIKGEQYALDIYFKRKNEIQDIYERILMGKLCNVS